MVQGCSTPLTWGNRKETPTLLSVVSLAYIAAQYINGSIHIVDGQEKQVAQLAPGMCGQCPRALELKEPPFPPPRQRKDKTRQDKIRQEKERKGKEIYKNEKKKKKEKEEERKLFK